MFYSSGTGVVRTLLHRHQADASYIYSPSSRSFTREITSRPPSWKCDVKWKIRLQSEIMEP